VIYVKKIPETQEEWIKYGNIKTGAKKRVIPVVEIPLEDISTMWDYEYQAKYISVNDGILQCVLASNSLINLKKEIKMRKWVLAWLTTSDGAFSRGQEVVDEYPYCPKYR